MTAAQREVRQGRRADGNETKTKTAGPGLYQCRQLRGLRSCITMVTGLPVHYKGHVTTLTFSKIDRFWLVLRWLRGFVCITIVT